MYLKAKAVEKIGLQDQEYFNMQLDTAHFRWRSVTVYLLAISVFTFLFLTVFQLQIVEGSVNYLIANRTNQSQVKTLAPRGLIYDSNGKTLAWNAPSYSLYVKPTEINSETEQTELNTVAQLLGVDQNELYATYKSKAYDDHGVKFSTDRVTLKSDLSFDQYYNLLSNTDKLPGVYLNVEPIRKYENGYYFANIIGYVGDPNQADINNGIYSESQVGKVGLEKQYDSQLRGTEGVVVEEHGATPTDQNEYQVTPTKTGNNLYLTIDANWQIKLTQIMQNQAKTVKAMASAGVIINSRTGEVKALVTNPSYDNNLFAQGISATDYSALMTDPKLPMINRPIALQLPPGSIMKVIGATAGLESGTITPTEEKLSNRCMDLPGNIKFCEADRGYVGWVNVEEAMARSSNIFFCKMMEDMHAGVGYTYYYDIAKGYGIGSKTGIDLTGEAAGLLPSAAYKKANFNESWYIGDECNTVIGQGYLTVTPLQMTVAVSAVVNGGNIVKPYVVSKAEDQSGQVVMENKSEYVRNINVSQQTLDIVKAGLRMGVTAGTAGPLNSVPGNAIAKTGSADASEWILGKYYSGAHSWILGCFEYQGEEYCFTIMQEFAGRGYKTVPIMKKFINCLYTNFAAKCDAIN
jgi:penicillin-binding protein 2